ncbi:hypothetical protein GE061_017479 [Apolygus lucorum]|uniref:Uncharacterized protein n=1 Tax=Apolygus lucorum TaxID=248454 RepID=A0A8S9XAZ4_APOLU|nr:hypothetical protein GE061_017479 [Apolygus lucorum]
MTIRMPGSRHPWWTEAKFTAGILAITRLLFYESPVCPFGVAIATVSPQPPASDQRISKPQRFPSTVLVSTALAGVLPYHIRKNR